MPQKLRYEIDLGESLADAIEEVGSFLDEGLLDRSYVVEVDGTITSAVLVSLIEDRPFIGYVITEGNGPSEALFRSVGAVQAPS